MSYIKYSPTPEERKQTGASFWEIWQGLPDLHFKEGVSSGGATGLRYDDTTTGSYIWVVPDGYSAYKANPDAVFYAMVRHRDAKCLDVVNVSPSSKSTLEDAIEHAREMNHRHIEEHRKKLAKRK